MISTKNISEHFVRQMGCTATEFVYWLPRALPDASLAVDQAKGSCRADFKDGGALVLSWRPLQPTVIGLLTIPQLGVEFSYECMAEEKRVRVQKYFDMATQRGGG